MFDGFGIDYLEGSSMPVLEQWKRDGLYRPVKGVMPSVTNINNASICCGKYSEAHGIVGNSYFDEKLGVETYMEAADLLLAPTVMERAGLQGVKSALLSSKAKTITFLLRGCDIVVTAEQPTPDWVRKLGPAPPIYSADINYWLMRAAIYVLKNRPDIGVLYVHTTDYPMHMWPPEAKESQEHLARMDDMIGQAAQEGPIMRDENDRAFVLCERASQRCFGDHIEMVGRLVEH